MSTYIDKASLWLTDTFDKEIKKEIKLLIDTDQDQLADRFYKDMEFGTGGMRGIMGAGTNRINKYTLGKATQGLSNYLIQTFPNKQLKVAIAFDCRHNSQKFAKIVADVFSANGIKVFLFEDLRPTPELSFAVKHLNCDAGIVLTASHNPPEYNGYKVYWNDGGQIVPPHDSKIIDVVNSLNFSEIKFNANENLIEIIGEKVDSVFTDSCVNNGTFESTKNRDDLKVVFTSLHGTSIVSVPEALEKAGYNNVHIVEEQRVPNGDFPTVVSPNPEEPAALKMATDLADKIQADIVIGTDPDCDRLGIAVRNLEGKMVLLNGNQTMCLMTDFLIKKWQEAGKLNGKQFVGSTIVSTNLVSEIADRYGVVSKVSLTGFKWIAKMIRDAEGTLDFIGGGEESFGYMVGDFVRDKDAVSSTLLACEIAADAKSKGSSMYQELLQIYVDNNFYKEHLIAIVKKGMDGAQQISQMMVDLRENPVTEIDGSKVLYIYDYDASTKTNLINNTVETIEIPTSNVLIYETEDGTKIAARPSGTEPKIKFYFSVKAPLDAIENAQKVEADLDTKIQRIITEMKLS
ncbi:MULTISPECIES: phospho-sugar mutase [Flavobacteriaceae]|uniref:Phospho-sugar mutase n=2 Tax=Flavobacteriaceae TaxID=49546 RepID=A0A4Y8AXU7_9FLAO|nr:MULTISPECIES: phospho-sugar mutase [Flavobacteriaceae]TEW76778.1 phospho-sugar mutase [Gramella jeungdoensis]GGK50092.1 phosphoglucomutase [Lutibacter litoralis]